jgi:hypothetical protein
MATFDEVMSKIKLGDHILLQNPDDKCLLEEACVNEVFEDGIGVLVYANDSFMCFYAEVYKGELEHTYQGHIHNNG